MKKLTTHLLVLLFVAIGCKVGTGQPADELIHVDVTAKYPQKELLLQDIFDVEYIPLETTDEFVTMGHIQALGEEALIVRNRNQNSSDADIYFFDNKSGKALKRINRHGQGAEEYISLLGITLDEYNEEIFVNDYHSEKIIVYDLFGNFKRSFDHKDGATYVQIYNFDQNNLICLDSPRDVRIQPVNKFIIISKQDGSITDEILISYEEKKTAILIFPEAFIISQPRNEELVPYFDSWILVEHSSDTIYRIDPDYQMKPFITRTPSIHSMNPEVLLFPGVLTDRYYFMQTVKKEYDYKTGIGWPRTNLMYDKEENIIYESVVYNNDFPDKPIDMVCSLYGIILINNNEVAFLQRLEAYELVEAYEEGRLKGKLKEITANLDEESNPVIMIAKHKK